MPWLDIIWTDENEAHVNEHGLTREDIEYVLLQAVSRDASASSGRPMAYGETPDGTEIVVVYEDVDAITVLPITAYPLE